MDAAIEAAYRDTASAIGMQSQWLYNVIALESAWKPHAYNKTSGATGLIQFIPRTMKDMGLLSKELAAKIPAKGTLPEELKQAAKAEFLAKYPDAVSQLRGPVKQYLSMWKPFPTEQAAYMAVFYPAYRYVPPDTVFSETVQKQNPGIKTVGDYVAAVKKKISVQDAVKTGINLIGIAALVGIGYYLYTKR